MKNKTRFLLSFLTAFFFYLVGVFVEAAFKCGSAMLVPVIVANCLPIVCYFVNLAVGKSYAKAMNKASVAEMSNYLHSHRDAAAETAESKLSLLCTLRRISRIYAVFIFVCAAMVAVGAGTTEATIFAIYAALLFFIVYGRGEQKNKLELPADAPMLDREEYKTLYSLADRASEKLGYVGEIKIFLAANTDASIAYDDKNCVVQIGVTLLHLLSEDELYEVLLHEFAHIVGKDKRVKKIEAHYRMLTQGESARGLAFTNYMFFGFDSRFYMNYMLFDYASSVIEETKADSAMAKYGDADTAVSVFLKLQYTHMYEWTSGNYDLPSIYTSETLERGFVADEIGRMKATIKANADEWRHYAENEILSRSATHPTCKMRAESLGVTELKTVDRDSSDGYKKEAAAAIEYCEDRVCNNAKESYDAERRENYLEPLERINKWTDGGKKLAAESYADIVTDLQTLGRKSEAIELCERAIKELPHESALFAYFMVGCARLSDFDESGIEYIYTAVEDNMNFLDEGMEMIGKFCCITGRQKELDEYRRRVVEFAQKDKDEYSKTSEISNKDELVSEHLPDGMLEDILGFIKSQEVDIVDKVYLVRKIISPTFFTSAFIIHFRGGTDKDRDAILHNIFRYLDSYPVDWQFSLFNLENCPDLKLEKIEGSLVYEKKRGN